MNRVIAKEMGDKVVALAKAEFPGYLVEMAKGSFGELDLTLTIKITTPNSVGLVVPRMEQDFIDYAERYGLQQEDFQKTFISRGRKYTVIGLNPRKRKYVVITKSDNGKKYGWTVLEVKELLGK